MLSIELRQRVIDYTSIAPHELRARGVALALDRQAGYHFAALMIAHRAPETAWDLVPGAAYVTPPPPFDIAFPGRRHYTTSRHNRPRVTEPHVLPTLSLADPAVIDPFRVTIDSVAGSALEAALGGRSLDLATVHPNETIDEFALPDMTAGRFFGVRLTDGDAQRSTILQLLGVARAWDCAVAVVPELTHDDTFREDLIEAILKSTDVPPVIFAGSAHLDLESRRVNRGVIIYPRTGTIRDHDKMARATIKGCDEDIDCARHIVIHASARWNLVAVTCADLLEPGIAKALTELSPNLVLVAAMSEKFYAFEAAVHHLVDACQAVVVVANGPTKPTSTPTPYHPEAAALFGRPVVDSPVIVEPAGGDRGVIVLDAAEDSTIRRS